jgi:hypothetical protein
VVNHVAVYDGIHGIIFIGHVQSVDILINPIMWTIVDR